MSAFD